MVVAVVVVVVLRFVKSRSNIYFLVFSVATGVDAGSGGGGGSGVCC